VKVSVLTKKKQGREPPPQVCITSEKERRARRIGKPEGIGHCLLRTVEAGRREQVKSVVTSEQERSRGVGVDQVGTGGREDEDPAGRGDANVHRLCPHNVI